MAAAARAGVDLAAVQADALAQAEQRPGRRGAAVVDDLDLERVVGVARRIRVRAAGAAVLGRRVSASWTTR